MPEPPQAEPGNYLGVDMGIVNIATTDDGDTFSGSKLNNIRARYTSLRGKLQAKGTRASRRLLKHISGREKRFMAWVNHNISKEIVDNISAGEYTIYFG